MLQNFKGGRQPRRMPNSLDGLSESWHWWHRPSAIDSSSSNSKTSDKRITQSLSISAVTWRAWCLLRTAGTQGKIRCLCDPGTARNIDTHPKNFEFAASYVMHGCRRLLVYLAKRVSFSLQKLTPTFRNGLTLSIQSNEHGRLFAVSTTAKPFFYFICTFLLSVR